MANNLRIVITASDRATATVRRVKDAIGQFTKPIRDVKASVGALAKETGLTRVGKGLSNITKGAAKVLQSVTGMKGGILGLGVLGPGGVIAAIGAVTTAVVAMSREWAKTGAGILRSTQVLDIASDRFQTLSGAAEAFGLDAGTMQDGLKSLGNTMEDALYGRNQQALLMMRRLGIEMHKTKNGSVDLQRGLYDVADAIARTKNVEAQGVIARTFGVEALLPLLQKGSKGLKEFEAQSRATGAVMSKEQLEKAQRLTTAYNLLGQSIKGAANRLMADLAPALTHTANDLQKVFEGTWTLFPETAPPAAKGKPKAPVPGKPPAPRPAMPAAKTQRPALPFVTVTPAKVMPKMALPPRPPVSPPMPAAGGKSASASSQAMAFYLSQGWTREQAAALVGNLAWESGLNPGQTGDSGGAYGLAQWHRDRAEAFKRFSGKSLVGSSLSDQLAFSQFELTHGGERHAGNALRGARSLNDALSAVLYDYERPRNPAASINQRLALAQRFYGEAGGGAGRDVQMASTQKHELEITLKGLPAGVTAEAKSPTTKVASVRVDYSLPDLATM